MGSAALLAQCAGVPVVARRVGGLPEIVRHEETGLLTDNEPSAIAATARLSTAEAADWGLQGREAVHQSFLVSDMAEKTLSAYRRML